MKKLFYSLIFTSSALGLLYSCKSSENTDQENLIEEEILDPNSSINSTFDGKIFSIPSPLQTAMLVRDSKYKFNEKLLNNTDKLSSYITENQLAIILGIYGADLGYATLYKQSSKAIQFLETIKKITNELKLDMIFDDKFITKFEENISYEDSLIRIVSESFSKADNHLKSNNRKNTSALILTGGWIETLYIACELNKEKSNDLLIERIGEQKETLNSIVEILDLYNKDGANEKILTDMEDLKLTFDKVSSKYLYLKPKTDEKNKLTTLQHTTSIKISPETLAEISVKINKIRTDITN